LTDRRPRWEGDEAMAGVTDGESMLGRLADISDEMRAAGWVTEDAAVHLGPSITSWLAGHGTPHWRDLRLRSVGEWLDVSVEWVRPKGRIRDLRADVFALIGSFAEGASVVTQVRDGRDIWYEVATGEHHGVFAAHGHLVRVRPDGRDVERIVAAGARPGDRPA
jgi:hypothetical protein